MQFPARQFSRLEPSTTRPRFLTGPCGLHDRYLDQIPLAPPNAKFNAIAASMYSMVLGALLASAVGFVQDLQPRSALRSTNDVLRPAGKAKPDRPIRCRARRNSREKAGVSAAPWSRQEQGPGVVLFLSAWLQTLPDPSRSSVEIALTAQPVTFSCLDLVESTGLRE
jgi:hypothetical protein